MIACLRILLPVFIITSGLLQAQSPPKKIFGEKTAAEQLTGVWLERKELREGSVTFLPDGRSIWKEAVGETKMTWKLDATVTPWQLELATTDDPPAVIFTVIEITAAGELRMAVPSLDRAKMPGVEELKKGQVMKRYTPEPHGGIHQVVEAHLKVLSGNWEIKEGGNTATLIIKTDGTYRMITSEGEDKGRFRIDVSKVPCKIDLLSTEGKKPTHSIYEVKPADSLRLSRAGKTPAECPTAFGDGDAVFTRKKP